LQAQAAAISLTQQYVFYSSLGSFCSKKKSYALNLEGGKAAIRSHFHTNDEGLIILENV
jgi:hypothetical protein